MSDEQTIYISPDDDLTTVRGRLEQIPSRKITLVIPTQTQLRSHVAWKLLYARARELGKEVLIVSSDPQVRSVAHAVKFRVAHSLESVSSSGPSRSKSAPGSRSGTGPGRTNTGSTRSRPTTSRATTAREPSTGSGGPRSPRTTRAPLAGQLSTWSEPSPFAQSAPEDIQQSHFNDPAPPEVVRPPLFNLPERPQRNESREDRGSRYNQSYDFRIESSPSIHPLSMDSVDVEEPDLLNEDYAQAQNIRQAASGSLPVIKKPAQSEPGNTSPGTYDERDASNAPVSHAYQSQPANSQVYGENDPFIYMQDDSQPPLPVEQKGEATIVEDEIPQQYPSLQKSDIAERPTSIIEPQYQIEDRGDDDDDDSIPPISPTPISKARPRPEQQRPTPRQAPEAIPLPMPRAQSRPLKPASKPLSARTTGKMSQRPDTQKPSTAPITRGNSSGSRTPQAVASRPASRPIQQRAVQTRPGNATGMGLRQPARTNRTHRPGSRRIYVILPIVVIVLLLLFAFVYFNISSTVRITIATQAYTHPVTLTLSNTNKSGTVPATTTTHTFIKSASEPATGSKMQATNFAIGSVIFVNTGSASIQIPSQTVIATADNINFVTTANALILPQGTNTLPPPPVPIQASISGVAGNVAAGSINVIPTTSLTSIAQAQIIAITPATLKNTLTASNPDATTGGEAKAVTAITQQDLDNAKKDLHQQALADINAWVQQIAQTRFVAQPVTTDTLINPPPVNQAEPNKSFSASTSITATILVAQLSDAQRVSANLLNTAIHADKQLGPNFAIVGDTQTIKLTQTQQTSSNTITVNAVGQTGPNLNIKDLQNSITNKSFSEAQNIVRKQSASIQSVAIQTQPGIFSSVSPWANHITMNIVTIPKKP